MSVCARNTATGVHWPPISTLVNIKGKWKVLQTKKNLLLMWSLGENEYLGTVRSTLATQPA